MQDDRFQEMLCDRQNRIWVAAFYGIYLFVNDHEGFKKIPFDTSGGFFIGHIFQLPGKPPWLHTSNGFYELDSSTLNFNKITRPELQVKLPLNFRHFSVFENTIFFSNSDSVFAVDLVNRSKASLKGKDNSGYFALNSHLLLLSTWKIVSWWYDFANKRITPVLLSEGSSEGVIDLSGDDTPRKANGFSNVNSLEKINEKEWLLVSTEGVYRFNINSGSFKKLKLYNKGRPLQNYRSITNLYFDRHQNIWMSCEYGLITFKPNQETIGLIRNFEPDPGKEWNNNVRNIKPDEKGNFWLATGYDFAYWDLHNNNVTAYSSKQGATDQLNHPSIRGLYYDGKYVILGPTNGGIWLFDPITKKYRKPLYENGPEGDITRRMLEGDFIREIKPVQNGNYIISAHEIYIMDSKSYKIRRFLLPGKNDNYHFSYQDSQKRIWIGSSQGLHCLDSQMVYQFSVQPGIRNLYSMCELAPDEYLGGGFKGLIHIKISNGKSVIKKVDPLFDNVIIASVIKDRAGKIWLPAVNNYLYKYDPIKHKVDSFDQTSNLQGNYYNYNSFYQSPDGLLFLGGINGINYFYPDKIGLEKDRLQITITKLSVNLDDTGYYSRNGPIHLRHFQNSIEVAYISPYYGNSSQLQYRYRLQGVDTGWRSNGINTSIRFTSLSHGRYVFHVAASVNGTDWFESSEKLSFIIAPPFWKTWWFRSFVVLLIAGLIYFIFKSRMSYIKRQQAEKIDKLKKEQVISEKELLLLQLNHDLAITKLTALRVQMNPHFIFNSLNSIQQMVLRGEDAAATKYLSRFSKLLRIVLQQSDKTSVTLQEELETLNLYLELEALRYTDSFEYSVSVDEKIDTDETEIPTLLIQPFVENAIWHGLLHKQGKRKLCVHFGLNNSEELVCTIDDNGIGREAAAKIFENEIEDNQHTGKGIKAAEERLHLFNQQHKTDSRLEILDKKDENGNAAGTKIIVTLPELN